MLKTIIAAVFATAANFALAAVELTDEQRAAIEARIAPVGTVCVDGESCGAAPAMAMASGGAPGVVDGEATYNTACMACHSTGAGGAPMLGDMVAWEPRLAKGIDALYLSGLNGVAGTSMLAKGGRADISDEAVMASVDHMVQNSQ